MLRCAPSIVGLNMDPLQTMVDLINSHLPLRVGSTKNESEFLDVKVYGLSRFVGHSLVGDLLGVEYDKKKKGKKWVIYIGGKVGELDEAHEYPIRSHTNFSNMCIQHYTFKTDRAKSRSVSLDLVLNCV